MQEDDAQAEADATGDFDHSGRAGSPFAAAATGPQQGLQTEPAPAAVSAPEGSKVERVCDALRSAMQAAGSAQYLKPILTSLAKVAHISSARLMHAVCLAVCITCRTVAPDATIASGREVL